MEKTVVTMTFDYPGDAEVIFVTSEMINQLLITVETSSNTTSSRYASAEFLAQFSTADRYTRMKVSDEINMINDKKNNQSYQKN